MTTTYSPITSFVGKDSLSSGDPLKRVMGSEITAELNAIAAAINAKLDRTDFFVSGTKIPFYQNAAPTGWTALAYSDYVLTATLAGSGYGGTVLASPTWAITGLTGSQPTHTHGAGTYSVTTTNFSSISGPAGTSFAQGETVAVAGTSAAGGNDAVTITSNGTWRPPRAFVILCSKN